MATHSNSSHLKKTIDWTECEINDKKWLPLNVKTESIAEIISNLGLRHMNISDDKNLFNNFDEEKVIGFFCKSVNGLEFEDKEPYSKPWTFIPVKIENSTPTIQILNLCAVNGKHKDITYGYLLEKYLKDSSKENCSLSNSVYAITPIPFAHNTAAKDFPAPKKQQQTYVFAKINKQIILIGNDGCLYTFKQSDLAANQFVEFARTDLKCDVYVIVEDPFKELNRKLDEKKANLTALLPKQSESNKNLDESLPENDQAISKPVNNAHLDESFSYDDLKELSELSAQIEDAESFELMVDDGSKTKMNVSKTETNQPSKYLIRKTHRLEEQIRGLVKEIEDTRKVFPHICWNDISDSDLYGSKEYLKFYVHYKKVVHVATPKILKSYSIAPIRTPKTEESKGGKRKAGERKRSTESESSSINEPIPTGTPKRRRSSKPLRAQNNK